MRRFLSMLLVHFLILPGVLADNLWQENAYVAFVEPYGYARLNSQPGSMATIDGVTYKLPKAVTVEERESIVELTQRILAQIRQTVPVERALTITLVDAEYPARVDGDSLWIALSAVGTADYPAALVKLVCGNTFPAALMRGWGSLIHEALGNPAETVTVAEALDGLDPMYLDLNEACFLPEYADEATIAHLTALSRALQYSGYVDHANVIHAGSLIAFLHEYIHAQTSSLPPYMEAPWRNEAIAYYLSAQPETPELNYSNVLDQWNLERLMQEDPDYLAERIAHLGHQPNVFHKEDTAFLCNVQCMENQIFGVIQNQPAAIRAFVHWLSLSHTRADILDALILDAPEASLGASWDALTRQWHEMVWEEFSWVKEVGAE